MYLIARKTAKVVRIQAFIIRVVRDAAAIMDSVVETLKSNFSQV